MKLKNYSQFFVIIFLLCVTNLFSQSNQPKQNQDLNPFAEIMGKGVNAYGVMTPRLPGFGNFIKVKGDVTITGNQIINRTTENNAGTASGDVRPILDASGQPTNLPALTTRANANYGGNLNNDRLNFEYVDVDSDATTFSSSTANLLIRDAKNGTISPTNCKKIVYAGLYWAAFYPYDRIANTYANNNNLLTSIKFPIVNNNWNQVKFKVPGGTYQTLTADTNADAVGDEDDIVYRNFVNDAFANNSSYVCYKNVTNLVKDLADANGTYAVADMLAGRGNDQYGLAGGWSLVVVFESPTYPLKYVSIADGFKSLYNDTGNAANRRFDFTLNGFKTLPSGVVNARIGVAALDGDRNGVGDIYQIKNTAGNYVNISNSNNQSQPDYANNNFFSSNITLPDAFPSKASNGITKTPNNSNTLGFDLDLVNVFNPGATTIGNSQTSADFRIETTDEVICPYLNTFSVDIAEAKIILTKVIKKTNGTLVANNGTVALGEQLNYVIGFQNVGTADATNTVITDVLPANVIFDQTAFTASLPAGVTFTSYNTTTRLLTLAVANNLVEKNGFRTEFNIEILVEKECSKFANACANLVVNNAQISYFDVANAVQINNQNSCNVFNTAATCPLDPTTGTTNFKVDTSTCVQNRTEVICNGNLLLTAPTGYTSYAWSQTSPTTATLGTGATQNVTSFGTYQVVCTPVAGCDPVTVIYKVIDFLTSSLTIPHPVNPFSDTRVSCTNDGIVTEIIALCGASDSRLITTGITTASSITWQIKNTTGCLGPTVTCPNTDSTCYTNTGQTGPNFLADTAGDYRVVIAYNGASNCTLNFHFRVTKGSLNATAISKDISCTNPGAIIVNDSGSLYEHQLQGPYPATTLTPWQDSNTFSIPIGNPGTYKAFIRLKGAPSNTCVYTVPNISVLKLNLQSAVKVFNPSCNLPPATPTGSVTVKVIDGTAPFLYYIRNGTNNTTGFFVASANSSNVQETFSGLAAGNYTAQILISGGATPLCSTSQNFTITVPTPLVASVGLNKPYTFCSPGEVQVNIPSATSGTSPYLYYMDSSTTAQYSNLFTIGDTNPHTFKIVDANGCTFTTQPYTMVFAAKPTFTVTPTDIVCDPQAGVLTFATLTNPGGYTLEYQYSGGCFRAPIYTASPSPTIINLVADSYTVRVKCTLGTAVCYVDLGSVVIKAQFQPLSATGGVSALAGCGTNAIDGEIRITNPQGGSGNYSYSFDNDVSYQVPNYINKPPGTYDIYIKDNTTGCKFKMNVILLPKPTPPTIGVVNSSFNCNGTATSTVTITNGPNFAYQYFIDNNDGLGSVPNPNTAQPNVFLNVPCGPTDKTIKIKYKSTNIPTFSNLLNEDFGIGSNTTTPGIAAAYCYNDQCSRACNNTSDPNDPYRDRLEDGQYVVTRQIIPNNGNWWVARDHTSTVPSPSNPTGTFNPNGRFLAINVGAAAGVNGILYSKKIYDVIPNEDIIVEAYVSNLLLSTSGAPHNTGFTYEIRTSTGFLLASEPSIPDLLPRTSTWLLRTVNLKPGGAVTPYLVFNVLSSSTEYNGNDAVIDDIRVYQLPKACITEENFLLNVPCNKAFTASVTNVKNVNCFGEKTAAITITAENFVNVSPPNNSFQYSVTGPAGPWYTSTVSPVVISATSTPSLPLGAGTVNVVVRYDAASVGCTFPLPTIITEPTILSVTATKTNATCLTGGKGTIKATPVGGVAPFQYQLLNSSLAVVPGFGYGSTNINNGTGLISNVNPGTYFVQIQDANLCTKDAFASVTISGTTDPQPVIAATSDLCYDTINQAKLIVDVPTGGLPPFTYSIVPAATFIGNSVIVTPGTYTITVTDANGCKGFINSLTIRPALSVNLSLNKDLDCTTPTPEGIIRGTISGGLTSYTYQVSTDNGVTYGAAISVTTNPFTYNVLASGVPISGAIKIKVTDGAGCTAESTINISPREDVTGTATPTIATCGANNGTVTLLATAGAPGFTYSFNNPAFTGTTSYNGLAPGTYPFKIRDSKSCEFAGTVTVGTSVVITGAASFTAFTCTANSVITFTGMPANSVALGYVYSINGGSSFQSSPVFGTTALGNLAGTYVCIIKESNGCTKSNTLIIPPLNPPTNITFVETIPAKCTAVPTLTATVQLTATALNAITKYEITSPASAVANNTTGLFSGLLAGTNYTFVVTDSKNCTFTNFYTIAIPTSITVIGSATNVKCKGTSTGSLSFTVGGFGATPGTYDYTITGTVGTTAIPAVNNTTATTLNFGTLAAGDYTIIVTSDATGCTATKTLKIAAPAIDLTASNTPTPIGCGVSGLVAGQVQLNGLDGSGGYTYTLTAPNGAVLTGTATGFFGGLTQVGAYLGTVTDSFGCTVPTNFSLINPGTPTVTANPLTFCFNGGTANVVINVTNGVGPYQYNLDNAGSPTLVYNNIVLDTSNNFILPVAVGSHAIIIRDSNGCKSVTLPFTIQPQVVLNTTFKDADCSGLPAANISGTITGGYSPYRYQTSTDNGVTFLPALPSANAVVGTSFFFNPPTPTTTAVTYIVRVIDVNGCTDDSLPITINPIAPVTGSAVATNATCGLTNGTVTITALTGLAPFTYKFDSLGFTATTLYAGAAGNHTFQIRDSKGCLSPVYPINIPTPNGVVATVTSVDLSCNSGSGTITFNAPTSGTGPFSYSITGGAPFFGTNVFGTPTPLIPGTYPCKIKDSFGCEFLIDTIIINPINPPTDIAFGQTNTICTVSGNSATVTLTASANNAIVKYETIAPSFAIIDNGASNVFLGLASGGYTFQITDSKNCKILRTFVVNPPVAIAVSGQLLNDVACKGSATGKIRFNVSAFTPGTYSYSVVSTVGATTITSQVGQTATSFDLSFLLAGTYTITVTSSATGCKATDFVEVKEAGVLLDFAITNTLLPCVGAASITATVVVGSGIPGYTYVLDQPTLPNISQVGNGVFTGLTVAGTYTLFVTDVAGCTVSKSVTLTTPVIPIVAIDNTTTCVGTSGTASVLVTITGLNTPFKYSLDGSTFDVVTSNPFTISVSPQALPHTIIVKDVLECSSAATTFTVNPKMTITSVLTPLKCDSSGATVAAVIAGTVTNGYPGYGYQVYYSATLPVLPIVATAFSPAVPVAFAAPNYSFTTANGDGYYVLRFTDSRGCTADSNIIQVLPLIAVSQNPPTVVDVICNGDATGSITVNPTGGIPPYKVDFGSGFGSSLSYSGLTDANPLSTGTTYNYTIKDSNGCLYFGSATVKNVYDKITATTVVTPLSCGGGTIPIDGSICLTSITGGIPPYKINYTNQNGDTGVPITSLTGVPSGPMDQCFFGLGFGNYYITITDNNGLGCSVTLPPIYISNTPTGLITAQVPPGPIDCSTGGCLQIKVDGAALALSPTAQFFFAINNVNPYPNYFVGSPFYLPATNPVPLTPPGIRDPLHEEITFCGLTRGLTYNFVVYSTENNCYYPAQATVPVGPLSQIETTTKVKNISCLSNPTNDASVSFTFTKTDATSIFYEIYNATNYTATGISGTVSPLSGLLSTVNSVNDLSLLGLAVGTYYIQFTETGGSFSGCKTTSPLFTINAPSAPLVLSVPTKTDANCNPNSGTITAFASGGSGGFQYQLFTAAVAAGLPTYNPSNPAYIAFLNTFTSSTNIFNVNTGNYFVYVKDATGCVQRQPIFVDITPNPTVVLSTVSDQCTSTGSSYSFTATGAFGIAPYSYSIGGSTVATSATGLPAVTITVNNSGTYIVTITDAKGCTGTASVTIYSPITLTANEVIATTCPTNNNGQIKATATGGSGSFTYSIFPALAGFPNATGLSNNNITAGVNYEITATDNTTGCEKKFNITLNTAIVPTFTLGQTPVNCNDSANGNINSNGTITATLSGALNTEGPYTYQIVLPFLGTLQTGNNVFTGLTAQSYTIRVTSIKGCSFDDNITVQAPILLSASASVPAPFACTPTNATSTTSLTISASGGVGGNNPANYTYKIDGTGFLTTNVFNNIPDTGAPQPINYFVKDANGCIATGSVILNPLTRVTATVALQPLGALTCTTGEQVIVNATSGSGNYIYELQGSGLPASGTNTFSLTNAGTTPITYTFKVTDNITSCSTTATYVVNPLPVLVVNANQVALIDCKGVSSASINFTVANFIGTYTYNLFKDGVLYGPLSTSSGSSPILIPNLPAGNYTVNVFNAPLCDKSSNAVNVTEPSLVTLNLVAKVPQNCNNLAQVTVSASGGTPLPSGYSYAYVVSGAPVLGTDFIYGAIKSLDFAISPTWDVYVRDSKGCIIANPLVVIITKIADPTIVLPAFADNQCDLLATSFVITPTTFTVDPLATPLLYSIDGVNFFPAIPNILIPAIATLVTVTVKDKNGCTANATVTVYPKLGIDTDILKQPTCVPLNDGQIKFTVSGGSGNFTAIPPTISPSAGAIYNAATNTFSGLTFNQDYQITATDATTNCTITSVVVRLIQPALPDFTTDTKKVTCNVNGIPTTDGEIKVNLVQPALDIQYSYAITTGPVLFAAQASNTFTGLPTGNYTIRVTSSKGCFTDLFPVFVGVPDAFTATASSNAFICSNNTPQVATITVLPVLNGVNQLPVGYTFSLTGSVGTFGTSNTFEISDTGSPQTFSNISVQDANGCIAVANVVTIQPLPTITSVTGALVTRLSCGSGEVIQVNVLPVAPALPLNYYSYEVLATGQTNFTGLFTLPSLLPATYAIKVTNTITGCNFTTSYIVQPLPELKVTFPAKTDITCFGGTGSLTFAVSGYSGAYQYEVFETSNLVTPVQSITAANTSSPTITVSNLLAGNYIVKIQESAAPDCSLTSGSITIVQPTELKINLVNNLAAFCTSGGARVTVIGQGGTPGYSYVFVQDNVVVNNATVFGLSASVLLDPALNLNWDVYVKDANGCISAKLDVAITKTDDPILTLPLFADNKCVTSGSNYLITATAIGSGTLTYLIGNNVVTNPITVPIPTAINDLEITVKDANGCIDREIIRLYPALVFTAGITTYANCIPAGATPTGVITMTPLGGSGNLVVSLSPLTPSATAVITGNVISAIAPGTYTIVLTDTTTNCTREVDVIMPTPTPVTLDPISKSDATCFGGTNGTITVNLSTLPNGANNDPVYQYAIISSTNPLTPIRPNQTNKTFLDLAAGDYVIEVTSLKGCKLTQPVTIGQPNEIVVNVPTVQQFACTTTNIGNFASITVNPITGVTGGASIYTIYEFSNASGIVQSGTSNFINIINLAGGTYTVKVFDIKGCSGVSAPIVIAPFIKIDDATVTVPTPITCSSLTENIQVNVPVILPTGITTPPTLTYVINGVFSTVYTATNNSGAFNNLPIGQYQITITTTTPNTGCFVKVNHTVVDPRVYQAIVKDIKPVACHGDSTGSATIYMINSTVFDTPVGNNLVGPFTCIIKDALGNQVGATLTSTGLGSVTATGLPKGIYTAELVLNGNSCPATFDFGISEPEFSLSVTAVKGSEVGCSPKTGSILVTVSGGTQFTDGINPPYLVNLINTTNPGNPGPFLGNATSLEAGNYQVFVTDANGCTDNSRFVLLQDPLPITYTVAPSTQTLACIGDDTTINITLAGISGGTGTNYTFTLFNAVAPGDQKLDGPTSATTFYDVAAGTYNVVIEDGFGCKSQFGPYTVLNPTEIAPTLTIQTPARCNVQAILELGATGGTGPYTYSSDGGLTYSTTPFATSVLITTLANQLNYSYIVKDFNGCKISTGIITPPAFDPITLKTALTRNITCFGGNDGKISVTAQGGYDIDYSYSIATATNPSVLIAPVNTTGIFDNLPFGNYLITVTSTNSCPVLPFPFTLTQPLEFIVKVTPKTVKCFSDTNGELVLEIQNAIGNLQYAISSITDPTTANQFVNIPPSAIIKLSSNPDVFGIRYVISGLAPNSYFLEVKDAANCPFNRGISFVVSEPSELISKATDASILQEELCKFDANASFSIKISGGTSPYTVSLDNAGTGTYFVTNDGFVINPPAGGLPAITVYSHIFSGLVGGVHKVYVVDANGCRVSYDITLGLPVFINPIATISYPCPEDAPGILNRLLITVDSSINLVDVKFKIDLGSFLPSNNSLGYLIENLSVGTHTFEVLHANGCRKSGTFDIKFIDPLVLKLTEGNLNQIIAIATGGVAPYNYTFNDANTGPDNTYIYDKTGKYTVTVIDNSNCKLTVSKQFNFIDIFIPNFFSPNGDGENDGWSPQNTYNYKNLVFYVFDRYGRKIISLKEGESWDGKYDGQELPTGDYWYIVKTEESSTREFVGNFTLYR